ncbi:MAG: OmpA family protein [Anaerolineales bacterium]|nr:OmpA family protein [Anaerolineales bacterium]
MILFSTIVAGQDAKQDFADGEFFIAAEEYEEALFTFTKVYNSDYQDNANINFRIGMCLLYIPGRKAESIPYLEKAVGSVSEKYKEGTLKETSAPIDAHLFLGNAYRINMEFEKACEQYRLFEEYVGTKGNIEGAYADQQISSCANAVVAINNPVDVSIGTLGQINYTHQKTYKPVISHDLTTMAYMGQNPFYRGIYVAVKEDNDLWSKPLGINVSVVSEGNMDVVGLSSDGKEMLFAVSDEFTSNIYMSVYENERWNPALSLGKPINSRYFESHATFSPDNRSIYFTSNRNASMGGMDIFRSDLQEDESWAEPVNLGENINTVLNEETPVISPDGKRIYFSSQGHNSIGGFDVFYSEVQDDGSWGEPVNLGYPLNTTDDDFTISPLGVQEEDAVFLFGAGDPGQHPLFKFEVIDRDAVAVPVPFDAAEVQALQEIEEEIAEVEEEIAEIEAVPAEKYKIKPVFFGFDSSTLSEEAKAALDETAMLMKKFPTLQLEVFGHTDAIGSYEYNLGLSQRRAKAVADYLAASGVDAGRLDVSGKSESEHIALNRTKDNRDAPEGRQLNRRVNFNVSIAEDVIIEVEKIEVPDYLKIQ